MKKLWLVSAPEKFDKDIDILLGVWCIKDKNPEYVNKYKLAFQPDPISSLEEMRFAESITRDFAESYLHVLVKQLNQQLDLDYSIKFWRIILMPWLLSLCQITWLKQKTLNDFLKNHQKEEIHVELVEDSINWSFRNTHDFVKNGILDSTFNHWLFSRLIESKIPVKWAVTYKKVDLSQRKTKSPKNIKQKIYDQLIFHFPILSVKGMGIISGLILQALISFKNITSLRKIRKKRIKSHHANSSLEWNLEWEDLVQKTIPKSVFSIKQKNVKPYKRIKHRVNCGSNLYYQEELKIKIATQVEKGLELVLSQHGGVYGTAAVHSLVSGVEYASADKYLSWGWKKTTYMNGDIIPSPSPYLSKFNYKKEANNIIFINSIKNVFPIRINSFRQPGDCFNERNYNYSFIKNLDTHLLDLFHYRPSLSYNGGGSTSSHDEQYINHLFPTVKMIKGDLHSQTMKCRLLVVDGPNTTFSIAMATNIPVIAFWNPLSDYIDGEAMPYFSALKDVGILFDNPEDAAKQVNEIWDTLDYWWQQPKLQKARQSWVTNYARKSKHWLKDWIKIIWNL